MEGGKMPTLVQSVSRALSILNVLGQHPKGLTVKEIADRVGLNVSTTHHLVSTLEADHYVHRGVSGQCYLGLAVASLYGTLRLSLQPDARLLEVLNNLARTTRETTYINTWQNGEIVVQAIQESPQALRIGGMYVGFKGSAHARAGGKAMLAFLSEAELARYLAQHEPRPVTEHTIYRPQALMAHLRQVAEQGYAIDREEFAAGACCVASPVFSAEGQVCAALSVSVPAQRFAENEASLIKTVVEAARSASRLLGYQHGRAYPQPELAGR